MNIPVSLKPPRVLVVDDESSIRSLIIRLLDQCGFKCDEAENGQTALSRVRTGEYDLVITDLKMPKMNGWDFITQAKALKPNLWIVVVSQVDMPKLEAMLYQKGVAGFLEKPFENDVLVSFVSAHIAMSTRAKGLALTADGLRSDMSKMQDHFANLVGELEAKNKKAEEGLESTAQLIGSLIDQNKLFKGSHAERVAEICVVLADYIGIEKDSRRRIRLGALLHHIGFLGLPDEVINTQPSTMTPQQLEIYWKYPVHGGLLVREMMRDEAIALIIEHHAENFDGSGQPHGISGKAIPIGARILRLADEIANWSFDPETGQRKNVEAMIKLLEKGLGRKFDPALEAGARAFIVRDTVFWEQTTAVSVHDLKDGDFAADDVKDNEGILMVSKGTRISPITKQRLVGLARLGKMPGTVKIHRESAGGAM